MGFDKADCDRLVEDVVRAIDFHLMESPVRIRRRDTLFSTADMFPTEDEKRFTLEMRWFLRGIYITINNETRFQRIWNDIEKEIRQSPALGWLREEKAKLKIEEIEVEEGDEPFKIFWDDIDD